MSFEFDPDKSASNRLKHGIDFEDAQALWEYDGLVTLPSRPTDEERWLAIGRIGKRHWTAIFTLRGAAIRLISVRRARREEIDVYESF
jgi:uncharacterized DUF497 family protein